MQIFQHSRKILGFLCSESLMKNKYYTIAMVYVIFLQLGIIITENSMLGTYSCYKETWKYLQGLHPMELTACSLLYF